MSSARITLRDVARAAGVSTMTVSYALRGSTEVSAATRERVTRVARELGYEPDPLLQRLASYRKTRTRSRRGVSMAWLDLHPSTAGWDFAGSHVREAMEGARERARAVGYALDVISVQASGGWDRTSSILVARGIEGVILGQPPPGIAEARLDWDRFATVAIGRAIRDPELSRVVLNHVECVHRAFATLRGRGHRRIGLVMERADCVKNGYRNVSAVLGAQERFGVDDEDRVPPLTPERLTARNLAAWLHRWRVDGLLVHRHDQVERILPSLGLRIPDDIGYAHLSLHDRSLDIAGLVLEPQHLGSWAVDLCHWLLERGEKGLRDPAPSLMLTTSSWVEGRTLRPAAPRVGSGSRTRIPPSP